MGQVIWTETAVSDLKNIFEFIAKDSVQYASRFVENLHERIDKLEEFPDLGRTVPEFDDPNIREIIYGNYRIVYHRKSEGAQILRIHHSKRILK